MTTSIWILGGALAFGGGEGAPPTAAGLEMQALEEVRREAIRGADRATLEKLYAADFAGVTASGYEVDKERVLQASGAGTHRPQGAVHRGGTEGARPGGHGPRVRAGDRARG